MHYTIYKITNKINDKFYIGKHQTKNLNDGYMGSGKLLKRALEKYGIENFSKEILFIFDTEEEMNAKEKELIVISENSYNLCEGGQGGFSYINRTVSPEKKRSRIHAALHREYLNDPIYYQRWKNACYKTTLDPIIREKRRLGLIASYSDRNGTFSGKKHSIEAKQKIGKANEANQKGIKNSQYGSFWITNGLINKKIRGSIPEGFVKGRKYSK